MSAVKFINPEGRIVDVPAEEAEQFDAMGWKRADAEKGASSYASMKAEELKALIEERKLSPDSMKKADMVAALEAADAENEQAQQQ